MVEKYIKDGKVAVLYSPGYGAGWSTWNSEYKDFMLFDKGLVELAMQEDSDPDEYLKSNGIDAFTSGWRHIDIEWIEIGKQFEVTEYDGYEGFRFADQEWTTA